MWEDEGVIYTHTHQRSVSQQSRLATGKKKSILTLLSLHPATLMKMFVNATDEPLSSFHPSPSLSPSPLLPSPAISSFFSASCIPGAASLAPELCTLCQGQKSYTWDKNYFCEASENEPFYDSEGAFR